MLCDICSLLRASVFLFLWNIFSPSNAYVVKQLARSHFNSQMLHIQAVSFSFISLKEKTNQKESNFTTNQLWLDKVLFHKAVILRQSQTLNWVDLLCDWKLVWMSLNFLKSRFELVSSSGSRFCQEVRTRTTTIKRTVSMEPWVTMATEKWRAARCTSVVGDTLICLSLNRFLEWSATSAAAEFKY